MKKQILFFLILSCTTACSQPSQSIPPNPDVDVTESSASLTRYQAPEGIVSPENLPSSVEISLQNAFPIWRDNIVVTVNVSIKNTTPSHLPARVMGHLFIYSFDEKKPLYWSNIDMAFAEPASPGLMSILSIPSKSTKDLTIPIAQMTWADVSTNAWPDANIYHLIPTGKYLLRFEMDFYTEKNEIIGTAVSNFVQFTTILTAPEVITPNNA